MDGEMKATMGARKVLTLMRNAHAIHIGVMNVRKENFNVLKGNQSATYVRRVGMVTKPVGFDAKNVCQENIIKNGEQ